MPGLQPKFKQAGPLTGQVFAAVTGGQLLARGAAGNADLLGPAGADEPNCAGVATSDALPVGTSNTFTTPGGFYPGLDTTLPDENVAYARHGVYEVTAGGNVAYLDKVKCGALGKAVKWVKGVDTPDLIVGTCVLQGGGVLDGIIWIDLSLS